MRVTFFETLYTVQGGPKSCTSLNHHIDATVMNHVEHTRQHCLVIVCKCDVIDNTGSK